MRSFGRPAPAPTTTESIPHPVEAPRRRYVPGLVVGRVSGGRSGAVLCRASRDREGHRLLILTIEDAAGEEGAPVVFSLGSAVTLARRVFSLVVSMGADLSAEAVVRGAEVQRDVPGPWRDPSAPPRREEPRPPRVDARDVPELRGRGSPPASWARVEGGRRSR